MKSGAPSSAPAMCIYEKDNILKLKGENIKFVDDKYTIENASAGETYIFTE